MHNNNLKTIQGVRNSNIELYRIIVMLMIIASHYVDTSGLLNLIDDQTSSVIINWNESISLYQQLLSQGPSYSLMKKLAQYSVSIRERDFKNLQKIGAVEEPFENIYAITNPDFYKADTGLIIDNHWIEETFII